MTVIPASLGSASLLEMPVARPTLWVPALSTQPSEIHGKGLFADDDIPRFSVICEEALPVPVAGRSIQFDGELRWVNHSEKPNAVLTSAVDKERGRIRMKLIASRPIRSGEEITYSYSVVGHKGEQRTCLCGEASCPGYFHLRVEFGEDS